MSQYANYIREKTGDEIIEWMEGWATYRFLNGGKSVYIIDVYVEPEYRMQGIATKLGDHINSIAKKLGSIEQIGSVVPSNKGSTDSVRSLLNRGFSILSSSNDFILFRKDI